jgi:putative CocE/NonD family hydrolase
MTGTLIGLAGARAARRTWLAILAGSMLGLAGLASGSPAMAAARGAGADTEEAASGAGGRILAGSAGRGMRAATLEPSHPLDPMRNDKVGSYNWVRPQADFIRREVMIPMRDGEKLYTVVVVKKGVRDAPILLSRTPYDAAATTARMHSQKVVDVLPVADAEFIEDGYIRVYQDVRGQHGSGGEYVMTRPLRGALNHSRTDQSTDAWDTIDWLVKNVTVTNGKVGIIGSSYLGFTALMATINAHPALKAVVPQSPMVDGWMGDDWFHNGAFRMTSFDYVLVQTVERGGGLIPAGQGEDYDRYLAGGSAADYARLWGVDQLPAARKMIEHPAYDAFWQGQAVDKLLAARPVMVPMLLVVGQWDQEDNYGTPAVFRALSADPANRDKVSLAIGPWRHSGVNFEGKWIGPYQFDHDTAKEFRTRWMKLFLDCHLKSNPPPCHTPRVITFATGTNRWEEASAWPGGPEQAWFLGPKATLSRQQPAEQGSDAYVSDPAAPVPMALRPLHLDEDTWRSWMAADQRFLKGRADVLSYTSATLTAPLHVKGAPRVELHASTSGTDSDFVVKLIDVWPENIPGDKVHSGYQLPIGVEIFRGRYLHGGATPAALVPDVPTTFGWSLPSVDHVVLPGHRLMVQVQSSLFPLYDRNPQTFVPSIMEAKPGDYASATQHVFWGGKEASAIWLPVVAD